MAIHLKRPSSRRRFQEYRIEAKRRRLEKATPATPGAPAPPPPRGGDERDRPRRKRTRSFVQLFKSFWGLMEGYRGMMVVVLAATGFATLLGLLPPYGNKLIFDSVLKEHPLVPAVPSWLHLPKEGTVTLLGTIVLTMIAIAVVVELINLWAHWTATVITKRVQVNVRRKLFEHAVRLPLQRVYELKSGGVASILREDAGNIADLVFAMLYNPFRAIVQLLGILVVLATVDWRLLLGAMTLLPIVFFTHRTWISRIRPLFRDIRITRQGMDAHATESFGGMRVVRSFSRQQSEASTFTRNGHMMARQELRAWWAMRGIDLVWALLIPFATAILMFWGGGRVLSDAAKVHDGSLDAARAMTLGSLVMFITYLANLLGPIAALAGSATQFQNALSGLDRVLDIMAETKEMPAKPDSISLDRDKVVGRITFKDVSFTYANTTTPVLRDVNLDVLPGEMIALVGPSGAGKTTLCNLVARFYDPTTGSIDLDGVDLRKITVESYRRLLGIVEQDTFLFDGSIAANIAYGRRGVTMDEIRAAAELANAHEFVVKLEKGYDSMIGERGVKLSGGQRQRLTIARAILADPRILILDEATSNLDTESERLIQGSLHTLMQGRTSFVIAHRLSTVAHADRILVIEGGRIIEQGKHDELMAASGRYREMVDLQTRPPVPMPAKVNGKVTRVEESDA